MLTEAQSRLERQYATLAAGRKPRDFPVYALEHGFDATALNMLRTAAENELSRYGPVDSHWLIWTALAAEAGYRYAGEEYWPELNRSSQLWNNSSNRAWLRDQFKRFGRTFNGPKPVGRWAQHFNIISWPIAHAILPRYLQAQFAQHLYDLRFAVSDIATREPNRIGDVLLAGCHRPATRLHDFLQQVELTTQIVLALRDADLGDRPSRISADLLAQIVGDLEQRRESRDFLRNARRIISERRATTSSQLRAPSVPTSPASSAGLSGGVVPIAPVRLAARHSGQRVMLGAIFPDAAEALRRAGIPENALSAVRVRFAGRTDQLEPAYVLLSFAKRDRRIDALPDATRPFAVLEGASDELRHALEPLLSSSEASIWVLRRHTDGLYREVAGRHVRPENSYLIVSRTPIAASLASQVGLCPETLDACGAFAYSFELGATLSDNQRDGLRRVGVGAVTGIRVEPLGIAPGILRDAPLPTWFASDAIILRATADFPVAGFAVQLDKAPQNAFSARDGELCLTLEDVPIGEHRLSFRALARRNDMASGIGEIAAFNFAVAQPPPWPEAMRDCAGFRIVASPANASLVDVLGKRASLHVLGPLGRTVIWSLETYDAAGILAASGKGGSTRVGMDEKSISDILTRLRDTFSEAIDNAHRVDIVASLGELGRQALSFPNVVEALRWRFDPRTRIARLIDESVDDEPIHLRRYDLTSPLTRMPIDATTVLSGIEITPPGALLIAQRASKRFSVFVSAVAPGKLTSLADIGVSQRFDLGRSNVDALRSLIISLRRWHRARPVGNHALVRQAMTTSRIEDEITRLVCGSEFLDGLKNQAAGGLELLQKLTGGSPGFGMRMRTFSRPVDDQEGRERFTGLAQTYRVEANPQRCALVYQLAFKPHAVRLGDAEHAAKKAEAMLANPTLARGAYLARLAAAQPEIAPLAMAG